MLLRGLSWTFQEQKAIPGSVSCAGSTAEPQGPAPRTVPAATRAPGRLPAPAGDVHERSPVRPRHSHPGFHLCSDKHPECHHPPDTPPLVPARQGHPQRREPKPARGPRPRCRGQMVALVPLSPPATLGGPSAGKPSREGTEANGNARGQPRAPRRHQGRARLVPPAAIPCAPLGTPTNPWFLWQNPPGQPGQKPSRSIPGEGSQMTPQQPLRAAAGRIQPLLRPKSLQGAHSHTPRLTPCCWVCAQLGLAELKATATQHTARGVTTKRQPGELGEPAGSSSSSHTERRTQGFCWRAAPFQAGEVHWRMPCHGENLSSAPPGEARANGKVR